MPQPARCKQAEPDYYASAIRVDSSHNGLSVKASAVPAFIAKTRLSQNHPMSVKNRSGKRLGRIRAGDPPSQGLAPSRSVDRMRGVFLLPRATLDGLDHAPFKTVFRLPLRPQVALFAKGDTLRGLQCAQTGGKAGLDAGGKLFENTPFGGPLARPQRSAAWLARTRLWRGFASWDRSPIL